MENLIDLNRITFGCNNLDLVSLAQALSYLLGSRFRCSDLCVVAACIHSYIFIG